MSVHNKVVHYTPYPHIVKIEGICGGEAIIEGTRLAVWHIVNFYYEVGMSVEGILVDHHELVRRPHRELAKDDLIEEGKDRGVRPDAECK